MTYERFEHLPVWKAAVELAVGVDRLVQDRLLRSKGDLVNQLERATLSVSNNVAEGFERGTTAELIYYLYVARGSAGEVRSALRVCARLDGTAHLLPQLDRLIPQCESISRQLRAWADNLQNSEIKGQRHLDDHSREVWERGRKGQALQIKLAEIVAASRKARDEQTGNSAENQSET